MLCGASSSIMTVYRVRGPGSLLHLVRRLIALRRAHPALRTADDVEVLHTGYPFTYLRGGSHLVVVNPRREPAQATADGPVAARLATVRPLEVRGIEFAGDEIRAEGFSYGIFVLS